TKAEAKKKLESFRPKIGYPDKWKDYSRLSVKPDRLLDNIMASQAVEYRRMLQKLGSEIDRSEWFMSPQTVNAYYNPSMNEIVFPAAILQPPFFNMDADDAVNYGAIVAVIGHEFSHGFDDQGRKSDGDGNLRDWWTDNDATEFKARADGLVSQYNGYSPIENMSVNGELTLGENIGDLAGLTMAYKAYKLSLDGQEAPTIGGYTGDQRFFMGWAQVWRRLYREDELRNRLVTDPHSPSEYRVNGIVSNMPQFFDAFDVKPGDALYRAPDDVVRIW
ncbi:MAG: M13-type metalloendopeptidase, partial [Pseudomonadota bacterium]